jgi:predicted transport protein
MTDDGSRNPQPSSTAAARPRSWREMSESIAESLVKRTGEGVDAWNAKVRGQQLEDEPSLRAWLTEKGVTGYPQMLLVYERFGYPDYLTASADELVEGQYADRPALRPILDAVLARLPAIGDVSVQTRKTYVALVTPRRTFAAVQPTTKQRVDLGLRLEGVGPTRRLRPAPNFGQSAVTMKVGLSSAEEVDDEVEGLLRQAYEQSA